MNDQFSVGPKKLPKIFLEDWNHLPKRTTTSQLSCTRWQGYRGPPNHFLYKGVIHPITIYNYNLITTTCAAEKIHCLCAMGPATHYKGLHENRQRTQPRFALWRLNAQDIADDGLDTQFAVQLQIWKQKKWVLQIVGHIDSYSIPWEATTTSNLSTQNQKSNLSRTKFSKKYSHHSDTKTAFPHPQPTLRPLFTLPRLRRSFHREERRKSARQAQVEVKSQRNRDMNLMILKGGWMSGTVCPPKETGRLICFQRISDVFFLRSWYGTTTTTNVTGVPLELYTF